MNGCNSFFPAVIVAFAFALTADASLIAEWNFDDSNLDADAGSQSATAGLTTTNGAVTFPDRSPGKAFQMGSVGAGGQSFTLALSGIGLSAFQLSYEAVSDRFSFFIFSFSTSYSQVWSWSTDNLTYSSDGVAQPGEITSGGGYGTSTVNFSGVTALNGAPTIYLRNSIGTGGTTNLRFDNLSVEAVPEPQGIMAVFLGVALLGFVVRRKLRNRRKVASHAIG